MFRESYDTITLRGQIVEFWCQTRQYIY